jgi:hypothetical protein
LTAVKFGAPIYLHRDQDIAPTHNKIIELLPIGDPILVYLKPVAENERLALGYRNDVAFAI